MFCVPHDALLFSDEFPEFRTGWTLRDARVAHLASADSPYDSIKIQPNNELLNDFVREKAVVCTAVIVTAAYLIAQVRAERGWLTAYESPALLFPHAEIHLQICRQSFLMPRRLLILCPGCLALWILCQFGGLWVRRNQIHKRLGRSLTRILTKTQNHFQHDRYPATQVVPHQDMERVVVDAAASTDEAAGDQQSLVPQVSGTPNLPISAAHYDADIQQLQRSIEQLHDEMNGMHSTMMQYFGGKSMFHNQTTRTMKHML